MFLCTGQESGPLAMCKRCRKALITHLQDLAFIGGQAVPVLVCFFLGGVEVGEFGQMNGKAEVRTRCESR